MLEIPDYSKARVLVVGDVMLDRYWHGATQRISPEAPVPVVRVQEHQDKPGGAANVALNIAALGAQVTLLGVVGHDDAARALRESLAAAGVQAHLVAAEGVETITKLRVISRHQQLIRLDFEDGFANAELDEFEAHYQDLLGEHEVVVLSDYAKGTLRDVPAFISAGRARDKVVLVDPKRPAPGAYRGATLLTPNISELEAMAGAIDGEEDLVAKGGGLIDSLGLDALLVTRGEHGMTLLRPGQPELHLPSEAREVFDVTGAGDTVIAVTAAGLGAGASLERAVALANLAAGLVVSKLGTAAISAPELHRHVALRGEADRGVVNESQLLLAVKSARARDERLVMTNGVFDILHAGHVTYLEQTRQLGDRLIVAVNDDASVKRIKGPGRPVNSLERRMSVLAALNFVDWVVPFSEDTPERLICEVLPDLLVKGADYRPEEIAGGDCVRAAGGEVRTIELVEGVSTTNILRTLEASDDPSN
jgi:D-beta-D-heptose 7-phosphate kinase/D-beta-D-heptose 1-phosphate adenosyltransferase